jgi:hypothetical protein
MDTPYRALEDHSVFPPSGSIARRVGAKRYFTGAPCTFGHVAPRYAHNGQCLSCARVATAVSRRRPEAAIVARSAYEHRRDRHPEKLLWYSAKTRARALGVPFDITFADVRAAWPADGKCPALGIQMAHNHRSPGQTGGGVKPNSPTLDRIIPNLGYVRGNICVISQRANAIKSNETNPEAIYKVAIYLENHLKATP